ncbi:hypothetical protein PR202_ga31258 [Eleusine coracana subsp. coracana]|uniref:Uncharacterized protein n=1 Tax=Eleusine coracana subsp. coracana TaxID=191504 RepID=A0AAV5DRD4_ELECO|nr:hypothetical protein PR202_ga31258 [Eleusine coracana subsp. coracana]
MSRFLHRAAIAATRALGRPSDPRPYSGLFLASASPSGAGHLGLLARARPSLRRDLDTLLTPEALLLDATHVLVAAALRDRPHSGRMTRRFADDVFSDNPEARFLLTLVDAEDGRFDDMLNTLARLAAGSPGPALSSSRRGSLRPARPGAVADAHQSHVAAAALRFIDDYATEGGMSAFQVLATGLLKHAVKRACSNNLALDVGVFRVVAEAVALSGRDRKGRGPFYVVQAFQALLSAVVLRTVPLCGERVHAALRVVGGDLERAIVEGRDAADLRLLLAFLAARNGYFDEALDTYAAAARDSPSDPRPHYLAHKLCVLAGLQEQADKWLASYEGLVNAAGSSSLDEQDALRTLAEEAVVAVALGVGFVVADDDRRFPVVMRKIVGVAGQGDALGGAAGGQGGARVPARRCLVRAQRVQGQDRRAEQKARKTQSFAHLVAVVLLVSRSPPRKKSLLLAHSHVGPPRNVLRAFSRVMGLPRDPRPYSGLFLASYSPSGPGHLGLVRARPALRDLNALLAPESFLLDATHAVGATALRIRPFTGRVARLLRDVTGPQIIAEAEAQGDAEDAEFEHIFMALVDAKDGRLEDALARLATERPGTRSRLVAASFCDLLGRVEDCDRWLASIPENGDDASLPHSRENIWFQLGLVAGAPGAVAGSQDQVASAACHIINDRAMEGHMSSSHIIVTAFLKLVAARTCTLDRDGIFLQVARDAYKSLSADATTSKGAAFFVLDASLALLSAAVLRALPLCGESIRSAARVSERDLARAVEEGDASTAASLRLLLAFLAARDGRFDEALEWYAEMARDDPCDPWPHYLAHALCLFSGRPSEEADKWEASYKRLGPVSTEERVALYTLKDELVIALVIGGSPLAFKQDDFPVSASRVINAAATRVDAALVSALQDKERSVGARLELRAVLTFLHAWTWWKLKELKGKHCGNCAPKE